MAGQTSYPHHYNLSDLYADQPFFARRDTLINFGGIQGAKTSLIFNWIGGHYGYANLMIALFVGFWLATSLYVFRNIK